MRRLLFFHALIFFVLFLNSKAKLLPHSLNYLHFPKDSIGQIIENGIVYILYRVEAGETIFRISQKYDVTTLEIREANGLAGYDIEVGQILKIPRKKIILNEKVPIKHVISPGESLYSISKKYNVSIKDIIDWNQLTDFTLPEGKSLIVGYKNETSENAFANPNYVSAIQATEVKPRVSEKLKNLPPTAFAYPSFDLKKNKKYYEVSEIGEIVVSNDTLLNPNKLVALHDVVPVGKLIEITHLVTGRSVFVEVVGKKRNTNVILEVSKKVLDYLGIQNQNSFKTTILYRWEE
jgi:LysM repeat protein